MTHQLPSFQIRQFQSADLHQVLRLERAAFKNDDMYEQLIMNLVDLEDIPGNYINNNGDFLVCTLEDEIVGMGGVRVRGDGIAAIGRMRTKLELQNSGIGIGKCLIAALEKRAIEFGCNTAVLSTSVLQTDAQQFYEKRGYNVTHYEPWRVLEIHYRKDLISPT